MADGSSSDEELQAPMVREQTGPTGMPEGVVMNPKKSAGIIAALSTVPYAIGSGIAFAIYKFADNAAYVAKIDKIRSADLNLTDIYIAVVVMAFLATLLNNIPMYFKDKVMTGASGNLRANMTISKVNAQTGGKFPYVVLEDEGVIGEYNRSNRSMLHFVENSAAVLLSIPAAGFVFPRPTLILTCIYAIGRVMHQQGYVKGYGKHAPGFTLVMLSEKTLVGLVLMAAVCPGTPAATA